MNMINFDFTEKKEMTAKRIKIAFIVAVLADVLEFPIAYIASFQFEFCYLLARFADVVLDFITMAMLTMLLGFHWLFLPSFFVEVIPDIDLCPTWVGCVAFVVWQRKREQNKGQGQASESRPIIDPPHMTLNARLSSGEPPMLPARVQAPPPLPTALSGAAFETRLAHLNELRNKNLISQSEYDTKRQQILAEI